MGSDIILWGDTNLTDEQLQEDLQNLPSSVKYRELHLNNNRLHQTPDLTASKFSQLYSLNLSENKLKEIDLKKIPKSLKSLWLDKNELHAMPDFSSRDLHDIFLAGNKIDKLSKKHVPKCVKFLDLNQNNVQVLQDFPESTEVSLLQNPVVELWSDCFKYETTYNTIKAAISGDQILSLRTPPSEVFTLGYSSIKKYFESKRPICPSDAQHVTKPIIPEKNATLGDEQIPGCSTWDRSTPPKGKPTDTPVISEAKSIEMFFQEEDASEMSLFKILITGPKGHGKTSLKQSIKIQEKFMSNDPFQSKTISYEMWKMEDKIAALVIELGDNNCNKHLLHCFHGNAENNVSVIVQDITTYDYLELCETMTNILSRSPKSNILIVLTKCDLMDDSAIVLQQDQLITCIKQCIEQEIESFKIKMSTPHNCSKLNDLIERYQVLYANLDAKVHAVSCRSGYGLRSFRTCLLQIFHDHKQQNSASLYDFYIRLINKAKQSSTNNKHVFDTKSQSKNWFSNIVSAFKKGKYTVTPASHYIQKLPIILYQDAFRLLESIDLKIPYGNITTIFEEYLQLLHNQGLIIWINTQNLRKFIFPYVPEFIKILQFIFPQNPAEFFNFRNLTNEMRHSLFSQHITETPYNKMVETLCQQGLMSKLFLTTLAHQFGMEHHVDILSEMLLYYGIAYEVPGTSNWFTKQKPMLFFPWYKQNAKIPKNLESVLRQLKSSDKDHLVLNFVFKGNIPSELFHCFCVRVYKYLIPNIGIQARYFWKHNLYAKIDNIDLHFQLAKKETSSTDDKLFLWVRTPIRQLHSLRHMWKLIDQIFKEIDSLNEILWPGIFLDYFLLCPHCILIGLSWEICHRLSRDDFLSVTTENAEQRYHCDISDGCNAPVILVRKPPEDNAEAEKCIDKLSTFMKEHRNTITEKDDPESKKMKLTRVSAASTIHRLPFYDDISYHDDTYLNPLSQRKIECISELYNEISISSYRTPTLQTKQATVHKSGTIQTDEIP